MFRRLVSAIAFAVCFTGFSIGSTEARAKQDGDGTQVIRASQDRTYTVIYWNVRFPGRPQFWATYSNYVDALRACDFINSYPEYRAIIR